MIDVMKVPPRNFMIVTPALVSRALSLPHDWPVHSRLLAAVDAPVTFLFANYVYDCDTRRTRAQW